eukprot:2803305-Prymnesium_polylepis.1
MVPCDFERRRSKWGEVVFSVSRLSERGRSLAARLATPALASWICPAMSMRGRYASVSTFGAQATDGLYSKEAKLNDAAAQEFR